MRDDDLVALTITDVRVAVPAGNGVEAGLVVLQEDEEPHRRMQMYVAQPEARAIHVSWSHGVPPRPSTWDLFISTISLLGARIDRVIINDVQEQRHYFAQLVVYHADSDEPHIVTARPSDALALALRAYGATLYAHPHVLDEAGLLDDGSHWVRPRPESEPEPDIPEEDVPLGGMLGGPVEDREPIRDEPDDADRPSWLQQLEDRAAGRDVDPDEVAPATPRRRASRRGGETPGAPASARKTATRKAAASKAAASKSVASKAVVSKAAAKKAAASKAAAKKGTASASAAKKAGAARPDAVTRAATSRSGTKKAAAISSTVVKKAAGATASVSKASVSKASVSKASARKAAPAKVAVSKAAQAKKAPAKKAATKKAAAAAPVPEAASEVKVAPVAPAAKVAVTKASVSKAP